MTIQAGETAAARPFVTRRRVLLAITAAVTLLAIATAFHDLPAVGRALRGFHWALLPAAVLLSVAMFMLRFVRWHLYARRVARTRLSVGDSLLIYTAGLGTHLTPGRVGEVVRCAFLERACGAPASRSAPIILAERITDAVGLIGVALPGALLLGLGGRASIALLALPPVLVALAASRRAHRAVAAFAVRLPGVRRYAGAVRDGGDQLRAFQGAGVLAASSLLSIGSVALEAATLAVVLRGLNVDLRGAAYLRVAFILPSAMIASAIFVVPGNLGVAEGGLAALTRATLATSLAVAAAAAVLVRLCTLWLGLIVGAVALAFATRRWGITTRDA